MLSGLIEGGAALLIAISGAIFLVGQMRENAKRNQEDIEAIKKMISDYQEDMKVSIEHYQNDMKDLLDKEKENSRDSLSREIMHIRETLSMNINEIRGDIRRLEQNQNENSKLREEVIILRQAVKSLHRRLDVDPNLGDALE